MMALALPGVNWRGGKVHTRNESAAGVDTSTKVSTVE